MIDTATLRTLASNANDLDGRYMANTDPKIEDNLLASLEDAEEAFGKYASPAAATMHLFGLIDSIVGVADRAAGDQHRGRPYEIGKAKREAAAEIAREIRNMITASAPHKPE